MDFTNKTSKNARTVVGDNFSIDYTVNYDDGEITTISAFVARGDHRIGGLMLTRKSISLNVSADDVSGNDYNALMTAIGADIVQLFNPPSE